jgi:methyl-accepting chemotaxis protein
MVVLISLVVVVVSLGLGIFAVIIATRVVTEDAETSMISQAEIAAALVSEAIHSRLNTLQELANQREVRSMDFETQKAALIDEIERTGADEFAIIYPDGSSPHLKGGQAPNLSSRDYVQKGLRGEQSVSDIIVGGAGAVDLPYPVINYVVPIKVDGVVAGGLFARNNATLFSDIVKNIGTRNGGFAYLINNAGVIIAHRDTELVMQSVSAIKAAETDPRYETEAEAVRHILSQKQGAMDYDIEGRKMLIGFSPVSDFDMTLVAMVEEQVVLHELTTMRNLMFMLIGVFMVFGIIAALLIARSISRPIVRIMTLLKDISEGDLTRHIDIPSKDEVGELAGYINFTVDKIKSLIMAIRRQSSALFDIGSELAGNMEETAAAVNEITANIHSINGQMLNQSASVTETHATMEQITININKLSDHVDSQSAGVAQSSSAIEEIFVNIQSVTQILVKNIGNVKELMSASEVGRTGLQEVAADIQEIIRESEGLLEINGVMENIASQTNLLSMNAAIEAAHAGEAGKGFAVVADEIRKLAENSGEQSKTISTVLKKIKDSIDKIRTSTDNVLKNFEAIDSGVKTVSGQEEYIRKAMEEEGIESKQILEAISRLNETTQMVKGSSQEMLEGSRQVIHESKSLEMVTLEITNGMNEMAVGAGQINLAVNRVNEISGQNKETIDRLVREVSKFKVE